MRAKLSFCVTLVSIVKPAPLMQASKFLKPHKPSRRTKSFGNNLLMLHLSRTVLLSAQAGIQPLSKANNAQSS